MKENIVNKYRHTALFYLLSTLIPWAFWFSQLCKSPSY